MAVRLEFVTNGPFGNRRGVAPAHVGDLDADGKPVDSPTLLALGTRLSGVVSRQGRM